MDTQRLLLYMALGFLSLIIYQTWLQDYHPRTPVTVSNGEGNATGIPGVAVDAGAAPSDLPAPASGDAVAAPAATPAAVATSVVTVQTDVMDIVIDTVGATISGVELLDYPVSIDEPDTSFTLMSDQPNRYMVAQSGFCLLYTSPSPRDQRGSRMPSSA